MTEWQEHEPIYIQLAQLVLDQIIRGALAEGEAAPSVRQVASQERINPLTVSRAYQTLVDDGLLEKRRGLGMFVAEGARDRAISNERRRFSTIGCRASILSWSNSAASASAALKGCGKTTPTP